MSFINIYIHLTTATKYRKPLLKKEFRQQVFDHIKENALKKDIYIDTIGGYTDHMHAIIALSTEQTISRIVQLIKGESSHWINQQNFLDAAFEWQEKYWAESVSPASLNSIRAYINMQEFHHRTKTFEDELEELKKYGLI